MNDSELNINDVIHTISSPLVASITTLMSLKNVLNMIGNDGLNYSDYFYDSIADLKFIQAYFSVVSSLHNGINGQDYTYTTYSDYAKLLQSSLVELGLDDVATIEQEPHDDLGPVKLLNNLHQFVLCIVRMANVLHADFTTKIHISNLDLGTTIDIHTQEHYTKEQFEKECQIDAVVNLQSLHQFITANNLQISILFEGHDIY